MPNSKAASEQIAHQQSEDATITWREAIDKRVSELAIEARATSIQVTTLSRKVEEQGEAMESVRGELAGNTEVTQRVEDALKKVASDTSDLVDAAKAMSWIAKIAKPLSYVVATCAAIASMWAAFKAGVTVGPKG